MNSKTRQLTEGAMIVAIVGILILADRGTAGVLYSYIYWLMPMPILIYATKYGLKPAIIPLVCVNMISLIYAYDLYMKVLVLTGGIIGLVYGSGLRANKSTNWLLVTTFVITLLSEIVSTFLVPEIMGYNFMDQVTEIYTYYTEFLSGYGYDFTNAFEIFKYIYVASVIVMAALETILTHLLSRLILKRLRIPVPDLKPIGMLNLPKPLTYGMLLFIIFASFNGKYQWFASLTDVFNVIAALCELVYAFMGYYELCFFSRVLQKKWLVLLGIFMMLTATTILAFFGMFMSVSDLRNKMIAKVKELNEQK